MGRIMRPVATVAGSAAKPVVGKPGPMAAPAIRVPVVLRKSRRSITLLSHAKNRRMRRCSCMTLGAGAGIEDRENCIRSHSGRDPTSELWSYTLVGATESNRAWRNLELTPELLVKRAIHAGQDHHRTIPHQEC